MGAPRKEETCKTCRGEFERPKDLKQSKPYKRRTSPQFVLRIDLGNEAMQTREHVGGVLRMVADVLGRIGQIRPESTETHGPIFDTNGNKVGEWTAKWPTEDPEEYRTREVTRNTTSDAKRRRKAPR